jgi:hypothetical protein
LCGEDGFVAFPGWAADHSAAAATSLGYVDAIRICETRLSGYSAIYSVSA